ncbi:proline-, glutamic acid- and leucine-rich protein 1-like [Planococcus citri]|uniref:proline-, glutamic acid- and leucine-rich protein 1-like n=1 Tax=Planococcus citri TaxID=170843 RepID=UPI0031F80EA9
MENSLTVLHSLLKDKDVNTQCFNNGLAFVEESQLLNFTENANVQEIVSLINAALHNPLGDRLRALQVLGKCSKQCSDDVFTSNAILWMQHCTQWSPQTINVELKILNNLIIRSFGNPDLKKQINSVMIPRITERLSNCSSAAKSTVVLKLVCLQSLLDGYSSSCSQYRTQLYKHIVFTLKNYCEYDEIVSAAARCLMLLHSCGSAGQQGINYKERWTSQFNACISTYHKLLDQFYGDIEQMKIDSEKLNETAFDDFLEMKADYQVNPTMRYFGLSRSCNVLTSMMQSMLLGKFPVGKTFNIRNTMNLICRILSVTYVTLQDESLTNDIIALGANLPFLHLCAFELLQAVIICAKRNLIVHSTLICKLCIQSLKWISNIARANETIEPFRDVKRKAYSTLSTWLSIAESCSSIEVFADELVPLLIPSIEHRKQSVTLLIDPQKKKGKRKRSQFSSEISLNAEASNSSCEVSDEGICCLAHNTLQLMLRNASVFIKWEHHKTMQTVIVNLLLDIQKCSTEQEYPSMYSNAKCRLMLYGSLLSILTEPHSKWFAPTSYAVNIFNAGLNDPQISISTFCRFAVTQIEAINHPKAPSLLFCNETTRNNKPSADVERLLAVTASIETPASHAPERVAEVLKSCDQTNNVTNSNQNIVHDISSVENDHVRVNNSAKFHISLVTPVEKPLLDKERSDSPSPKKLKMDQTLFSNSVSEKKHQQDSSFKKESVETTISNASNVNESSIKDDSKIRSSLWPDEDGDVDLMLKDFVDDI